ncbi:PREDICTED: uncharacterized protein LOC108376452 isoform X2 [Rhagoletis zephyria]|uniref:uncharacterized protein LOC108376452 isoform X1 n=1 Tax=Rhagoletis zephyria TaxID=28612 RepID=UPI0008117650|nr:PREDICTED: uncharacterized protein LOC108376452 isoform X1 [Rhagoletis zephyria]XP_017488160.1 PREDICTED: uncharacterized protein LOC108376452 isoform X2 [Rhagoletis zephyria]
MALQEENNHTNESSHSVSNGNGAQLPDWITAELFNNFLKETVPGFREIKSFKTKSAVAPGENYATIMLRIAMEISTQSGKEKTLSYMMKIPLESIKDLMEKRNVFDIETMMYRSVVPEMEQMYRDAGIEVKFSAGYYDIQTPSQFGVILLEDLRQRGFKNINRLEGLDMDHARCVLKKLAQWHAASATRVQLKGLYPASLTTAYFLDDHYELMKQIYKNLGDAFLSSARSFPGNEEYIESLEKFNSHYFDSFFNAGKVDPNEFNVLNHGDCWSNNVMFQYDAFGRIKETYFVDYQIPKYGSPAQDLYYLILSSTSYDLKLKQFDYFVKFYHENLAQSLTLLKYPKQIPKLKDLHILLHRTTIWAYTTIISVMGAVLLDPTDKANIVDIVGESEAGDEFKKQMYTNARFRRHAEAVLPWLFNRGVLEC